MENTLLKIEGMDCNSCAISITKTLEKKGLQNVRVNYVNGDVSFLNKEALPLAEIEKNIENLGYRVVSQAAQKNINKTKRFFKNHWQRFIVCLIFSLPLFIGHIVHIQWLMQPLLQLSLATVVYLIGIGYFGKSAVKSLLNKYPNMNVLITLGTTAAYGYSLYGLLIGKAHEFMFFETTATTITLVFLGNYLEERTSAQTQTELQKLLKSQITKATMIAFDDQYQEQLFEVDSKDLKVGDLVLIKSGEKVPADCKILWGNGTIDESIITGESIPIEKKEKETLIGGSIVNDGAFKAQVSAAGNDTVLAQIITMIQNAQSEKPPMQLLADKISAVFVPAVIAIAILTLIINQFVFHVSFSESLIRAVAVLVISCPCAMGLATPAAIAVGLGRASKNGVLFKDSTSLEKFKHIKQIVFDKTGTLTTGAFNIQQFSATIDENEFKKIVYSLEKFSNHPIASAISNEWKQKEEIKWNKIDEIKGLGMQATDKDGNHYTATSFKGVITLTQDHTHNIYITKNKNLIGWIDVKDEIRPEAKPVILWLHSKNIKTILLSGDKKEKCERVAKTLGIDEVYAEQTPADKIAFIAKLNASVPTAMVGDGINDAPALAKASLGISLAQASQLAIQSAQVVLMRNGLDKLPFAMGIGKHTYITIQENLFWALIYNVVAIPVAAVGLLGHYGPTYGALIMGLSDVVLAINSIKLRFKKVY
ncbi:MAG: cadmium-translocating P-type ATPase [Chitinophagaceae bacterium]|nr:cadmium-translocating P-type ATPase [Chitinophagaceae bacterium]